jgi:outer membrane protein assembly factor BamB
MPKSVRGAFVPQFLDVTADAKLGKSLAKAYARGASRDDVVKLLGDLIDADRTPLWVTWNVGELDAVGHLGDPMFCATAADEDEFYSFEDGPQLVMSETGGLTRFDGSDESSPAAKPADVAKLTAYDGGGYLLAKLHWVGTPPATIAAARKLLALAFNAASGELTAYERSEPEPATTTKKTKTTPAAAATMSALFLGDPSRSGCYAAPAPRKAPKVVWSSSNENGGTEYGGNPVVDEALGLVFAGDDSYSARCSATRLRDGKKAWLRVLTKNQSWIIGSAVVSDGVVYQPTNKAVFALDAKTGKVKWKANLGGVQGNPVVVGSELLIGSGDGVVGLSLDKGRKQWTFAVKRDDVNLGVRGGIALADNTIYFTTQDKLFAVDLATKKKLWTTLSCANGGTPSLDDSSVYTWTEAGLTAVDRATGKPRWTAKVKQRNYADWEKTIAVAADRVVVRSQGKLEAYDKRKGKRLWSVSFLTPYTIGGASPIIAGTVALCILVDEKDSDKRSLYAVDLATGKLLWHRDDLPHGKGKIAPLSWYCTPTVDAAGTVLVQAYGLHALR